MVETVVVRNVSFDRFIGATYHRDMNDRANIKKHEDHTSEPKTSETLVAPGIVRRSDRGLCVAGHRTTLYLIEDYLRAGWPPHLLQHALDLSDQEMTEVLDYLAANRSEFNREYQQVTRQAAEREKYWRKREHRRQSRLKATRRNFTPEQAAAWARLQALKQQGKAA